MALLKENIQLGCVSQDSPQKRTQDETLKQERCARGDARDLAKDVCKLKKRDKYILLSCRVMPAPFSKNPEEREFVIDSGASLHMMSKKDLSSFSSFHKWLGAFDAALASFGATQGCVVHGNVKSSARLLCPPERIPQFQGWDTPYVHDTVTVLSQDSGTTALGSALGSVRPATRCARRLLVLIMPPPPPPPPPPPH